MGQQPWVACGDLSGELCGRESFSVKEPGPLCDRLRRNPVIGTPGPQHRYFEPRATEATCRGNSKSRERAKEDGIGATGLLEKGSALLPSQALGGNGWVVKESVFKELGAGVKGEAATTDQTSKKKKIRN